MNKLKPMDLAWKIKLIDGMIRENPEVTIKDFIEAVREVNAVERATVFAMLSDLKQAK